MQCFDTFTRILTIDKDFSRVPKVLVLPPPPLSLFLSLCCTNLLLFPHKYLIFYIQISLLLLYQGSIMLLFDNCDIVLYKFLISAIQFKSLLFCI